MIHKTDVAVYVCERFPFLCFRGTCPKVGERNSSGSFSPAKRTGKGKNLSEDKPLPALDSAEEQTPIPSTRAPN